MDGHVIDVTMDHSQTLPAICVLSDIIYFFFHFLLIPFFFSQNNTPYLLSACDLTVNNKKLICRLFEINETFKIGYAVPTETLL